ncbi:hypothetical protein Cfor_00472, partial [Coptotermes formosanus]
EEEGELADYCRDLDARVYGLKIRMLKGLAFEYTDRNCIDRRFNKEKKNAGRHWRNIPPKKIFKMDETGINSLPKKSPKVTAGKGKRVVGKIVSADHYCVLFYWTQCRRCTNWWHEAYTAYQSDHFTCDYCST